MEVRAIKFIPNIISILRIIGSLLLLVTKPFSSPFFLIYIACCISDILDGYIARKFHCESPKGQVLDSVADIIFFTSLIYIFVTVTTIPTWGLAWIFLIAAIRLLSLIIGFIKYHKFSFLHTYTNKATGFLLACFPIIYYFFRMEAMLIILCLFATISACEEWIITVLSKRLNRNVKSIFEKQS